MGARARWRCVSIVVMGRLSVYLSLRASRRHDLWLKMNHLSLDVRQSRGRWRMHRHVRENQSFLVVALAQDFVLAQEELVAYTESVITLLTRKTFQVINVRSRPHHHLEGWNGFIAGRTVTSVSKEF